MSAVTPPRAAAEPAPRPAQRASAPSEALARHRRLLALAALGLLLALASAAWLALSGSGETPPATGAATIVPANAVAYVSLSTDSARPAVARARALAARFPDWPLLQTAALNRLQSGIGGSSSGDFAAAVRPWLSKEAAVALIASGTTGAPQPLVVLDVARRARAQAFLIAAGATPAGSYAGTRLLRYPSGTEVAFTGGHYLVAGPDAGVRAAIDAARGRAPALSGNDVYKRAVTGEPADRVLDAYLPAAGIRRLIASRTGVAGALGTLLDRPGLQGAAVSLSANDAGGRVLVHSVFGRGAASAAQSFSPTLQSVLPSGSALMLDIAGLDRAAPGLLRAAATAGIAGNVGPLLSRVGAALTGQGVNVRKAISLFDGETAVALAPGSTPSLLIVSRVRNQAAAQSELAALEGPMTTIFSPSGSDGGQIPQLADRVMGGVTVHEVGLGPGLQIDYAVFNRLVVISTSVEAIDAVVRRSRSLADDATYRAALADQPKQLSSLVFGDFTQLLRLGEQTGLASGALTRELLPDLSRVRAIGLSSASGERDTTTELTLDIP